MVPRALPQLFASFFNLRLPQLLDLDVHKSLTQLDGVEFS